MTDDTILRALLVLVICILVVWGYKWLALSRVGGSQPVELDPNNPRDVVESKCILEQNRWGRELSGYIWKGGQE